MDEITQKLVQLREEVLGDASLEPEVRTSLEGLFEAVIAEPTVDNVKGLAVVLEALADSEEYLGSLQTIMGNLPEAWKYFEALDNIIKED